MINNQNYKIANKEISLLYLNYKEGEKIKDESIAEILIQSKRIIKRYFKTKLFLKTNQIPVGGKKYLNCERAFDIFTKHSVMPEYCFSCYKIQIDTKNVVDLIKLYFLFDILYFENENLRKCMIDLRKNIKGNYKGFIYCTTQVEAKKIKSYVGKYLKESIDEDIKFHIKRGCSEFVEKYPEFGNLEKNTMDYKKEWKKIEHEFDANNNKVYKSGIRKLVYGLNLKHILVFENWIDFAKKKGDQSYKVLTKDNG